MPAFLPLETEPLSVRQLWVRAIGSLVLFAVCFAIAKQGDPFDKDLVLWTNSFAGRKLYIDLTEVVLLNTNVFAPVIVVAMLFGCWQVGGYHARHRIIAGLVATALAGACSRALQHLATHPRPALDPTIAFRLLDGEAPNSLNTWCSFPSDHASIIGGLVVILFVLRAHGKIVIASWIACVEYARVLGGAHYPVDLLGGLFLASGFVWVSQFEQAVAIAKNADDFGRRYRPAYDAAFFFILFQFASLAGELRSDVSFLVNGGFVQKVTSHHLAAEKAGQSG